MQKEYDDKIRTLSGSHDTTVPAVCLNSTVWLARSHKPTLIVKVKMSLDRYLQYILGANDNQSLQETTKFETQDLL